MVARVVFLIVLLACLGRCLAQVDCFGEGIPRTLQVTKVTEGAESFSFNFLKYVVTTNPYSSIVLSPFSIWSVLNLAYFGSKGKTEQELKQVLGVPSKSDAFYGGKLIESSLGLNEGTTFDKADKAYFDNTVKLRDCALEKITDLERVDFSNPKTATDQINEDVSKTTGGKITNFLTPDAIQGARFVLLNAVYFKGLWTYPFSPKMTATENFYDEFGRREIGETKMMNGNIDLNYAASKDLRAKLVELPYEKSNISMILILPYNSETVNSVLPRVTPSSLHQAVAGFKKQKITLSLPRFKMTTRIAKEVIDGLRTLGVIDLFDLSSADLSDFVVGEQVGVTDSIHQATIEVTEEGTVAAAATNLMFGRMGDMNPVYFIADRPFIFLIRDMSQSITLFAGVYRDPKHTENF